MTENSELVVYGAFGLYVAKEFLVPLVKGSFSRNVAAADARAKEVDDTLKGHTKELAELKLEQTRSSSTLSSDLGNISGKLEALDKRIAEQGKFHDAKLGEALSSLSTEFNRKLSATLNSELEHTVRAVVREELSTTRGKRK